MIGEARPTIKKRKYSRGGCVECKRRKMKCDEAKPECHNCTRLRKTCIYSEKSNIRFSDGPVDARALKPDQIHSSFEASSQSPVPQPQSHQQQNQHQHQHQQRQHPTAQLQHSQLGRSPLFQSQPSPFSNSYQSPQQNQPHMPVHSGVYPHYNNLTYENNKVSPLPSDIDPVRYFNSPSSENSYNYGFRPNSLRNLANAANLTSSTSIDNLTHTTKPSNSNEVEVATSAIAAATPIAAPASASSTDTPPVEASNLTAPGSSTVPSFNPSNIVTSGTSSSSTNRSTFRNSISDILTPIENGVDSPGAQPSKAGENNNNIAKISNTDSNSLPSNMDVDIENFMFMKGVFDEASLWVHDLNDLVTSDLLDTSLNVNNNNSTAQKPEPTSLNSESLPAISNYNNTNNGYFSGSESGKMSDTYDKHNFQLDEFSNHIVNQVTNQNKPDSLSSMSPREGRAGGRDLIKREDFVISNSELIDETIRQNNLEGPHVEYLKILTNTDLSYHLYPFASSVESNEVVHILLKYSLNCPYLLMGLLAISATFQHNQTGKLVHDLSRQKYLSVCLTLLSKEFNSSGNARNNYKLANDIERLLLTVLVLTTNFTATSTDTSGTPGTKKAENNILNSWKTHLRGAKDLLVSYSAVKSQMKEKMMSVSPGLALAKTWFFAIESLAGLMSPLGGTVIKKKEESEGKMELETSEVKDTFGADSDDHGPGKYKIFTDTGYFLYEQNPEYHDSLVKIGFLSPTANTEMHGEFNIFIGFTIDVVYLNQEFIESLNSIRSNPKVKVNADKNLRLMSLIHKAKQVVVIPGVSHSTHAIPTTSIAHPDYTGHDKIVFPATAYAKSNNEGKGPPVYYSWFDVSQQIRVDAVYLRILVSPNFFGLPKSNHVVEELVKRLFGYMFFVKEKEENVKIEQSIVAESEHFYLPSDVFDLRCAMIQASFRLCVNFAKTDLEFEKLQLFFIGLVKLGNGSALTALEMVNRSRERRRRRQENGTEEGISDEESLPGDFGREVIAFS
ncbi:hypothetical protein CLIB1423_08S00320 [[Candida] railenensis]|uniref:Zn(2)-C6 fungal-type domain-containing protein n=1 Tax=[Candida] railenensis TaxID=45579 RepID=A0A9P0QQJ3_9ASCO|nr:hypothetical protein CLIB1423_08S00320 [[Candida] railenensis]